MLLNRLCNHDPERIALRDEEHAVSYGQLRQEIEHRMRALEGVSVLAIALDNSAEWILWDLAAMQASIPCVPVPPFFSQTQTDHLLHTAGVSHLLTPQGLRGIGREEKSALPSLTAKVTFTSGTTGTPKGVCLPWEAMENVASGIVGLLGDKFTGTHACILPLAVLLENVAGVYAGLMAGCTIYTAGLQTFGKNYENLYDVLRQTEATSVILVPEILRVLMAHVAAKGPLPHLRFVAVGGSKVNSSLITKARKMGLPVYEGYGLSECASVVALNTPGNDRLGTVGKFLPHIHAHITNGQIQIRNPGFLGYVGEKASVDFNTGDLGSLDESGFLSVTGRSKNVLITSYGRNISPEWVEAGLLSQHAIAQTVVYGDAQPHLSALIVPALPDADIQGAVDAANRSLPDYAQIKSFTVIPPFTVADGTLTGTGRPRREQILKRYIKETDNELLRQAG